MRYVAYERIERQVRARRQTHHVIHSVEAQALVDVDVMRDQHLLKARLGRVPVQAEDAIGLRPRLRGRTGYFL